MILLFANKILCDFILLAKYSQSQCVQHCYFYKICLQTFYFSKSKLTLCLIFSLNDILKQLGRGVMSCPEYFF